MGFPWKEGFEAFYGSHHLHDTTVTSPGPLLSLRALYSLDFPSAYTARISINSRSYFEFLQPGEEEG